MSQEGWKHKTIVNQGDYEFMMVIDGAMFLTIDGEEVEVKKHECIVIPPYTKHFGYKGSRAGSTHYWVHFFPSGPVSYTNDYHLSVGREIQEERNIQVPQHFHIPEFEKIVILCKQLLDASSEECNSTLIADFITTTIAIELANQLRKQLLTQGHKVPTKFESILQWIRLHSYEHLTVQDIADHFEMTPVYLTRLFKKYHGVTTNQFITQMKIQQAEEILLTTDKSIKEIALELSFSSEKYFMRVFKKAHGITPTEFRNSFPKTYMNNNTVDPAIPRPSSLNS